MIDDALDAIHYSSSSNMTCLHSSSMRLRNTCISSRLLLDNYLGIMKEESRDPRSGAVELSC